MKDFHSKKVREVTMGEFLEIIIDNLLNYLPAKYHDMLLKRRVVDKVNNKKIGFYLKPKDGAKEADSIYEFSAVYYIEDAYGRYSNLSIEYALRNIAYEYADHLDKMEDVIQPYINNILENSYAEDFIKANVYCQLINADANKEMLENIPHRRFFEFAIIYRVRLQVTDKDITSSIISNPILRRIGCSEDKLYEYALENTRKMATVLPIKEMLPNLTDIAFIPSSMQMLYVIGNRTYSYGAASILIEEKLYELANSLDSDFYLIPSSIHEWLVLPDMDAIPVDIANMIKIVNMEQVDVDERLSNSVYVYHRKNREVSIAFKVDESILD